MRVIITGGTGTIGSRLSASLAGDGHEVIVLSRNPSRHRLPAGVRAEKWDARTAAGWGHLVEGAGAIVDLAGENIAGTGMFPSRWTPDRKRQILQSRLDAGHAVVETIAAAKNRPAVLIQASAVGYYGPRGSEIITEQSAPGDDFLAGVCVQWEESSAAVEAMGVRRVVIRTGIVLNANEGPLPLLALQVRLFAGGPLGSGRQIMPWIHIEDEVRAIRYLLDSEVAAGPYNLSAPAPLPEKELGKVIAARLKRPFLLPVPAFVIKLLFGEAATLVLDGQNAVPERLQQLGFRCTYSTAQEAIGDLL